MPIDQPMRSRAFAREPIECKYDRCVVSIQTPESLDSSSSSAKLCCEQPYGLLCQAVRNTELDVVKRRKRN